LYILHLQKSFFALNVSADYKMQLKNFMQTLPNFGWNRKGKKALCRVAESNLNRLSFCISRLAA
jgi:hypothetical protein